MKKLLFTITILASINSIFAQQPHYGVTAGNGNGLRFWNSDTYKIHMGNVAENHYGPVTDYSIKMNMSNTAGRGWTWGVAGVTPIAGLNTQGNMQIAGSFQAKSLTVKGESFVDGGWLRVKGSKGLYFQDYGGGFYMTDTSWIRTYGNKNFYHNTGTMRTDGTFEVGPNGNRFRVITTGNVGIGVTSPAEKLHINGNIRGNAPGGALKIKSAHGYIDVGAQNTSWAHIYTDRPKIIFNKDVYTTTNAFSSYNNDLILRTKGTERLRIMDENGNIGIGTTSPDSKLSVNGKIHAKEVKVDLLGWPDYVFEEEYKLPTLVEVENHIQKNGHLINIPSAKEAEQNGVLLGEMNKKLLEKIEELTLYTIAQEKEIKELQDVKIKNLELKNSNLEKRLSKLELFITSKDK